MRHAGDRIARRAVLLLSGLALYGASTALLVRASLGTDPWTVLTQGIARTTGLTLGLIVVLVSAAVFALWIPLRQRPGIGTFANAVLVGPVLDQTLQVLPAPHPWPWRLLFLLGGVLGTAVATGLYVGAGWGPGPRDGLMTGLARLGVPLLVARTLIEASVLVGGWLLGGTVGIGTAVYALGIGPLVAFFLPRLSLRPGTPDPTPDRWEVTAKKRSARTGYLWSAAVRARDRPKTPGQLCKERRAGHCPRR